MKNLQIQSYNIWFSPEKKKERTTSLIKNILITRPDVLCLQEVTSDTYMELLENLKEYKYYFPLKIEQSYDCAIISKIEFKTTHKYKFPYTTMGRSLLVVEFEKIIISTTHFESEFEKCNPIKTSQFKHTNKLLNNYNRPIVLCSDTNINADDEQYFITNMPENKNIWFDAWVENGSSETHKFTYDTITNSNIKNKFKKHIRSRIDRIIYKPNDGLKLNNFCVETSYFDDVEPSDHYAISATFNLL